MIKADHKKWARIIFNPYEEMLLKKNFSNFFITSRFPDTDHSRGIIIAPNHISWWDGFFVDYISRKYLNRKFHILMLEEELRKYPFFRKTGAFSINPDRSGEIRNTFNYAREILKDSNNLLVFYTQGKIEPFDKEPELKAGLLHLIKSVDCDIMPAAFRIEYLNKKKPAVFFRPGEIISSSAVSINYRIFTDAFKSNINDLKCDVQSSTSFPDLFQGDK
jgi:1-acyl-sn-glycerol-3-phosphate acyltransferase